MVHTTGGTTAALDAASVRPGPDDLALLPAADDNLVAYQFDAWLGRMMELADEILDPDEHRALLYYDFPGKFRPTMSRVSWQRTLRGIMRGEAWMIQHIRRVKPRRFVEIGAGLGTWCYLAAIAGAPEVTGVDIFSRYLAPSIKMQPHFESFLGGRSRVSFVLEDIYDMTWDAPVDIFYMKATLHHVLPLDRIFDYMYENLAPGGVVIVHDLNGGHPVSQYGAFRRRGLNLRVSYTDPVSGRSFEMANEDLITVPGILYRFWKRGFRILNQEFHLGFRTMADDWWYDNVIRRLTSLTLLGAVAAPTYTIVAQKPL